MNDQIPYTPPTLSENSKLDTARVYAERKRRERNEHDERIAQARWAGMVARAKEGVE